ncbi:MAG TPA: dihydrodipicolinate synthase family protein, partial [Burkholderiales bacterium]|nr:dihydrodipicolinate synthase family protein [Burkholderiales bacterium]
MFVPAGVIPAVLLPFHEDLSIDEASYRAHLRDVASVEGLAAITVNAHASEVASCTFDEQRRVLEISKEELKLPIVNGVYADGSLEAARIARMATQGGASALLVFPPGIYTFGQRPEMALEHFRRIADVTDLPLILFQYPLAGGHGYPLSTLEKIFDAVPSVKAIKDWCANPQLHERQTRVLQSRSVNVLTTHSSW